MTDKKTPTELTDEDVAEAQGGLHFSMVTKTAKMTTQPVEFGGAALEEGLKHAKIEPEFSPEDDLEKVAALRKRLPR
ncbi:MAG: hypothetical protein AAGI70_03765 [Pseudomonadota bacterium]